MIDGAGLSMERSGGLDGFAPKDFIDALHAQTDAQDRYLAVPLRDDWLGDAGVAWTFGSWADQNVIGFQAFHLAKFDLVAPKDLDFQRVLTEHLYQIIGERVIIVDDQKFGSHGCLSHVWAQKRKATQCESGWRSLLHNSRSGRCSISAQYV